MSDLLKQKEIHKSKGKTFVFTKEEQEAINLI